MGLMLINNSKVTRVILFSLYVFISLKIDQLVDIIMNLGYKSISGNPGKTRPLISGIPGNDRKILGNTGNDWWSQALPVLPENFRHSPIMPGSHN